jgi:hypothetical protein
MANGLVVADTGISVGGRAVLGANLGRVQLGSITHTSDTALATQAAGGSQRGSAVSMVVPSAGVIKLTCLVMECDETEGNLAGIGIAVKVGSDALVWSSQDGPDGAVDYQFMYTVNASVTSSIMKGGSNHNGQAYFTSSFAIFDIAAIGCATGTQDMEIWLGDNIQSQTGEITITGSTTTARFMVEIIDGS